MKSIAIIGAGNMGGAIARALAEKSQFDITVSNPTTAKLDELKLKYPHIQTTTDNVTAARDADIVLLAVKPWILPSVLEELAAAMSIETKTLISVAGGVSLPDIDFMLIKLTGNVPATTVMHIIPNTAIAIGKSMTFICARRATPEQVAEIRDAFALMGEVAVIEERLMDAATALSSCAIAYVFKYVQACVQAGVQLGFYPGDALRYVNATVDGAVSLLRHNGSIPQQEIDRVTTPGGMTIKGINQLEHNGFTSAVINAIIAPIK